ncbi:MAG TPA: hypothetical protein DGT23_13430 [Micromonosporaceae bacterium]|nr:hypothetical protein [Micromonosporaceae bacterium]
MDVAHPIRSVVPTLDGPVLEVLSRTTRPLTGPEIHRIAGSGSLNGVRRALGRLVTQGVVQAEERSSATFYLGNRDHLTWPAVESLASIRRVLLDRLHKELERWDPKPVHASLFGSTARGDGDAESDIDVLIISPEGVEEDESPWADQVDRLRGNVQAWTGNHCQTFQIDLRRLAEHVQASDPLVSEWLRDGIALLGPDLRALIRKLPAAGGGR